MPTVSATTAKDPINTSELYNKGAAPGSNGTLNQNDFLKLLVAQITFQDPLNPKSNTDMAAQMAQFTSLSQASATTASLAMIQANDLIGKSVTVQIRQKFDDGGGHGLELDQWQNANLNRRKKLQLKSGHLGAEPAAAQPDSVKSFPNHQPKK